MTRKEHQKYIIEQGEKIIRKSQKIILKINKALNQACEKCKNTDPNKCVSCKQFDYIEK